MKILFAMLILPQSYSLAQAQNSSTIPTHGVAMHGTLKYGAKAPHLDYANPDAPKRGTLKQSVIGSFDTLNANNIKGKPAAGLGYLYDRLAARVWDEPFTLYGLIAKDIIVPEDRSFISFKLNPKARFHDGTPITTDDVVFSFETLKKYGRPNTRNVYSLVKDVKQSSSQEITFTFGEGYDRETALILAMMPILPKHFWKDRNFDETMTDIPLGSGPYKIKSMEIGRQIVYERVKDYWAADNFVNKGQYNFDTLVYDYYRDKNVAVQAFKAHEFDVFREFDAASWQNNFLNDKDAPYKAESFPHQRPEKVQAFIFNTKRPIFNDKKVREALFLSFDFDWMNKVLFYGQTKRIESTFPNTPLASPDNAALFQDNIPLRKKLHIADDLLAEAGWVIRDGKRVFEATGEPFKFTLVLNQPQFEKVALQWAQNLKKLGIEMELRSVDTAQFTGILNAYDYDMVLHGWVNSLSPGSEQQIYWGCKAAETMGSRNYSRICDDVIDQLSKEVAQAKTYSALRDTVQHLDHEIMSQFLMIPLYYIGKDYIAYWSDIKHTDTPPIYGTVIETWWHE